MLHNDWEKKACKRVKFIAYKMREKKVQFAKWTIETHVMHTIENDVEHFTYMQMCILQWNLVRYERENKRSKMFTGNDLYRVTMTQRIFFVCE